MSTPLVRRSPVQPGVVVANVELTPRMRRVTVRAESMVGVALRPAQDVELHLVDETRRRVKRRYTIRAARPVLGEFDLDVALHGPGPGARWGATARAGDDVTFQGPRGKLDLRPAAVHLLVGDESALPAIAVICAALPAGERGVAVLEVHDAAEEQPVAGKAEWVHRGDAAPGSPDLLLPVVRSVLASVPARGVRGYLLGETRTMVALRALLEEHGIAHDAIFVKGYWNVARPDRREGRSPL
ncbi:MAG TPA: siderophore-interacting protein [Jatrophihabitans sp.]